MHLSHKLEQTLPGASCWRRTIHRNGLTFKIKTGWKFHPTDTNESDSIISPLAPTAKNKFWCLLQVRNCKAGMKWATDKPPTAFYSRFYLKEIEFGTSSSALDLQLLGEVCGWLLLWAVIHNDHLQMAAKGKGKAHVVQTWGNLNSQRRDGITKNRHLI